MGVGVIRPGLIAVALAFEMFGGIGAPAANAQTAVKFTLDGRVDGPATPFLVGLDHGRFRAEGLDVSIDAATNFNEAITRVASGTHDIGVADINALIRWRDQNSAAAPKAIFIVHNRPPYAIVSRRSRGVMGPRDLEKKKLGAAAADPASALWPVFAKVNSVDVSKVTLLNVGLPVREPMLAAGEIDAITGMTYGAPINLREKGVPADDVFYMLMADHGLELYGNAIIVNPKFAAEKPEAVKAFLRAYTLSLKETIRDPVNAVLAVMQRNGGASRDLELERLLVVLKEHIVTTEAKANGLGEIDTARFDRAIDQIGLVYGFKAKPKAADIFDDGFLPPESERVID